MQAFILKRRISLHNGRPFVQGPSKKSGGEVLKKEFSPFAVNFISNCAKTLKASILVKSQGVNSRKKKEICYRRKTYINGKRRYTTFNLIKKVE